MYKISHEAEVCWGPNDGRVLMLLTEHGMQVL